MNRRDALLKEMGVGAVWKLRERASSDEILSHQNPASDENVSQPVEVDIAPRSDARQTVRPDVSAMNWEQLETAIRQCERCGLCQTRTQAVPGVGDRNAAWLFVGEGPGFYEDQQGEPFVGASGKLLDNMLMAMGLRRGSNAYIANVVKCRATDNGGKDRAPTPEEAQACHAYLERQIALIKPGIIVAVGRVAATTLLGTDSQTSLGVLRGKTHVYQTPDGRTIPLVATYHPAYLLRQLSEKRKAWEDLCLAMRSLSTKQTTD